MTSSKYLENAVEKISKILMENTDPLKRVVIVVNNMKLKKWLTQKLAEKNGIFAGYEFHSFYSFLKMLSEKHLPGTKLTAPDVIFWKLFKMLPDTGDKGIAEYCENDLKRFQFAELCSKLFDHYQNEMPDLLQSWKEGKSLFPDDRNESWQKEMYLKATFDTVTSLNVIEELKKIEVDPSDELVFVSDIPLNSFQTLIIEAARSTVIKFIPSNEAPEIDSSKITVASCHNPQREVEVLYDNILKKLDEDPSLEPRDILVLTPDIEKYAPYFDAVFTDNDAKLRFTVSDNLKAERSPLIDAFNEILNLNNTRCRLRDMEKILSCRHILKKFGIEESDKDELCEIIYDAGFRRYIDGNERSVFHTPQGDLNTIEFTIKRLLLGYALKVNPDVSFNDVFPFESKEGGIYAKIGNLIELFSVIKEKMDGLKDEKTFDEWNTFLFEMVEDLFLEDFESTEELIFIRRNIRKIGEMTETGNEAKVSPDAVGMFLELQTNEKRSDHRFMHDGISLASLSNTGPLPFSLICFIGMNDGAFPGQDIFPELNLLARNGVNISRREKDENLFRNLVASANECIVTYTGHDSVKGRPLLHSSVIFECKKEPVESPLHPFSEKLFLENNDLFTYSKKAQEILTSLNEKEKTSPKVISEISLNDKVKKITIEELISFFKNPPKAFFTKSVGMYIPDDNDEKEEHEMFSPNGLVEYKIKAEIVKFKMEDLNIKALYSKLIQEGTLPKGNFGKVMFDNFCKQAEKIIKKIGEDVPQTIHFQKDFEVGDIQIEITGELNNIYGDTQVLFRPTSKAKAKDKIEAGIWHLFFKHFCPSGVSTKFVCFKKEDHTLIFDDKIEDRIIALLEIYVQGMKSPLLFMPDFSYKLFRDITNEETVNQIWNNPYRRNYEKDFYNDLVFTQSKIIDEDKEALKRAEETANSIFENTEVKQ